MFTLQISKQYAITELIFIGLAFFSGFCLAPGDSREYPPGAYIWVYKLLFCIIPAGAVAGWRTLFSNRNRQVFFVGTGGQYIMYLGSKFIFSALIGVYLLPFVLFRDIRAIVRNQM